jgi:hypothetical protein
MSKYIAINFATNVLLFNVYNNWYPGYMNWSLGEPLITNSNYLNTNKSIMVFIENNYTAQGNRQPEINATISLYVDRIKEFFEIRPIKINNLLTLSENITNSVSELVVKNNLNNSQVFGWSFDSDYTNISSSQTITLNSSENILVYIASNYSNPDIYKTIATVNSSTYNDTENGVIIA